MATLDLKKSIHEKLLCFQFLKTSSIILFAIFLTQTLNAQVETNFSAGGAVRVGDSSTACDASIEGAIRFDADGADTIDYCNGTSWLTLLTSSLAGDVNQGGNSFAAPMIIGTNDNNTLAFETNGSTRMTINTSGNVGIGTSSPAKTVEVEDSKNGSGSGLVLRNTSSAGLASGKIELQNDSSYSRIQYTSSGYSNGSSPIMTPSTLILQNSYPNGILHHASHATGRITFATGGSATTNERMRIDSSGNVGVGTTAPNTILDINGAESMRGMAAPAVSPAGQGRIYFDSTSNKYRVSQNGGAYSDLVGGGSGDFMASGTVPMTGELELLSENSATDPDLTFNGDENTGLFQPAADEIAFSNAGTESLRIDASGHVAIGGSPNGSSELTVIDSDSYTDFALMAFGNSYYDAPYTNFFRARGTQAGKLSVQSGDYIGAIESFPYSGSSFPALSTTTATSLRFVAEENMTSDTNQGARMEFRTTAIGSGTNSLNMVLKGSGDVGIGTSNPGFRLTVNDSRSTNPVAEFENDSTNSDADGIRIEIGPNSNPGTNNHFIQFRDGDGTEVGKIHGNGSGGVTYATTSDRRIKTDIKETQWGLDDLLNVRIVDYRHLNGEKRATGVIAQELYKVFPHLVTPGRDEGSLWTVDYMMMTPLITKSVQQLHSLCKASKTDLQRISNLSLQNKNDIATLAKRLEVSEKRNRALEKELNEIKQLLLEIRGGEE